MLSAGNLPDTKYTISGHVTDVETGEALIGANIFIRGHSLGAIANPYGFYSLTIEEGDYQIGYSYIGYRSIELSCHISGDTVIDIELNRLSTEIEEVVVSADKKNENITNLEMGTVKLPIQAIRRIPAFMGEVDVIKAIQLLPGVHATSEGSSGFSVRGGSTDQNLILLDEATVYNASHLMGFFSVFNNDAIKDVKLYKGDIPASHGGRLSSLLDVRMKEGNIKSFNATGGIGSISSRLTLEGPLIKEKTSYLVSGRRTYADVFLPFARNKDIRDNKLFFYDLNTKINHTFNENNRVYLSGYFGRDVFENQFAGMKFGNRTFTARWNHLFNPRLFSNYTIIYSLYNYELSSAEDQPNSFIWQSELKDISARADFTYYPAPGITLRTGILTTYHIFSPGFARGIGEETLFTQFKVPENYALEHGAFISAEQKLFPGISVKYGLRVSAFQNFGKGTVYHYDTNYLSVDSTVYEQGELIHTWSGLEPRLGLNYTLNEKNSFKASYNRSMQYIQLAQNSTAGTPLDIWFPASPNVKPQVADLYSIGYFRNFRNNLIEASVEAYYKDMKNTIDFKDHAALLLNPKLEGEIRTGKSWSYGLEFMVRLNETRLNGWISYTLSKTERKIGGINAGKIYPAPYDKPHDIAVVLNYRIINRLYLGANWVFASGLPVTFPTGRFVVANEILPIYSSRNGYRMANYHRLDLSLTYEMKNKPGKKWKSEWNLSVYNAYARKNPWAINFEDVEGKPNTKQAVMTYLFSAIPAITYNFRF